MGRKKTSGPSTRPVRIGEQIRQALSEMLLDGSLKDTRLSRPGEMITVTEVRMTPDLKLGRVLVSVFPDQDPERVQEVFHTLADRRNQAKREISRRLRLRFTPSLRFLPDESMAYGAHIESILREVLGDEHDGESDGSNDAETAAVSSES